MSETGQHDPTAAVVLIGNELLTGKVVDENGTYLVRELRSLGVTVREVRIVPDEIEAIGRSIRQLTPEHDTVFTSGGVGPTHDDITLEGIAAAFDVALVENGTMAHHVDRVFANDPDRHSAFSKMARVPEGTTLIQSADLLWPIYRVKNVYILPGVPEIFRRQFDAIKSRFLSEPFFLRTIYFRIGEGDLAPNLMEACRAFPTISLGSYPVWDRSDYRVRVTIESKVRRSVEDAYIWLLERFGGEVIFKVVDGTT